MQVGNCERDEREGKRGGVGVIDRYGGYRQIEGQSRETAVRGKFVPCVLTIP